MACRDRREWFPLETCWPTQNTKDVTRVRESFSEPGHGRMWICKCRTGERQSPCAAVTQETRCSQYQEGRPFFIMILITYIYVFPFVFLVIFLVTFFQICFICIGSICIFLSEKTKPVNVLIWHHLCDEPLMPLIINCFHLFLLSPLMHLLNRGALQLLCPHWWRLWSFVSPTCTTSVKFTVNSWQLWLPEPYCNKKKKKKMTMYTTLWYTTINFINCQQLLFLSRKLLQQKRM